MRLAVPQGRLNALPPRREGIVRKAEKLMEKGLLRMPINQKGDVVAPSK
jgi:hypothetical protein